MENRFNEIINQINGTISDRDTSRVLNDLVKKSGIYIEQWENSLKKQILDDISEKNENLFIYTALMKDDIYKQCIGNGYNIFSVLEDTETTKMSDLEKKLKKVQSWDDAEITVQNAFIRSDYLVFCNCLNRPYSGVIKCESGKRVEVTYYLRKNNSLVNKEKSIVDFQLLYGYKCPLIFSPYSRRYININIKVHELKELQGEKIESFELNSNHVEIIDCESQLVWNVKIDFSKQLDICNEHDSQNIYNGFVHHKCSFQVKNKQSFILPALYSKIRPFEVLVKDNNQIIFNYLEEYEKNFYTISFYELDDECLEFCKKHDIDMFSILYYQRLRKNTRIHTWADMKYQISRYKDDYGIAFEVVKRNIDTKLYQIIPNYGWSFAYYQNEFKSANTIVYIVYHIDDNDFALDYVNCILDNLNYWYPEILWRGVSK